MTRAGARAPGSACEDSSANWVRSMFGGVARRYDLLNHLLSFQTDRYWRARTAQRLKDTLHREEALVLDICCGTGDLLLAMQKYRRAPVMGSDFCRPMLELARQKIARRGGAAVLFDADALKLPLADGSLDLITAAFGFRNLSNYRQGLEELLRVLKPSGTAAILEFSQPSSRLLARLYAFYSGRVIPLIGGLVSGSRAAYTYLPDSVERFPGAEELAGAMRSAGFLDVHYERMTGGIVALHRGRKG